MFPFTIRSTITVQLNGNSPESVSGILLKRISDRLQSRGLQMLAGEPNTISFKVGIAGFQSGALFEFIDRGSISVKPNGDSLLVTSELSYLRAILVMTVVIYALNSISSFDGPLAFNLISFFLNWLGVIAVYILISVIRFRIMLRAEISKV
jgi:hypothetical protein